MITQARLKELFDYVPETGFFTCKSSRGKKKTGDKVGSFNQFGYASICIDGKNVSSNRMAWLFMTGKLPTKLGHLNGDTSDNRFCNLYEATTSQIQRNSTKLPKNSTSGIKGVSLKKEGYVAYIGVNGKSKHLGYFKDITAAANARKIAESKFFS